VSCGLSSRGVARPPGLAAIAIVAALGGWTAMARAADADAPDTVVLASGERVTGAIFSDDAASGVKIRLPDGSLRFYPRASVLRVEYGSDAPAAPPPPPMATGPAPAARAPDGLVGGRSAADSPAPVQALPASPPPLHVRRESLKPLWLTGLIVEVGLWAIRGAITGGVCATAGGCNEVEVASVALPVAGAFLDLTHATDPYRTPLILSGVLETMALSLVIVGASIHRDVTVGKLTTPLRVEPVLGPSVAGLSLQGRF
jgi:hypothetical protein